MRALFYRGLYSSVFYSWWLKEFHEQLTVNRHGRLGSRTRRVLGRFTKTINAAREEEVILFSE